MIELKTIKKNFIDNKIFLFNYNHNSFFEGLYRLVAIIISPAFIKLNPNFISFISLFLGFLALILSFFLTLKIKYLIIFFLISFILDFVDGIVARYNSISTFHGRFIDGLFDICVVGFLHIVLLVNLLKNYNLKVDDFYLIFFLITIFIMPIQHLILDRFSSLARWCNEISKSKNFKPYFRGNHLNKITMLLFDIQHFFLFYILIFDNFYFIYVVYLYFFISFFASLFSILLYYKLSKKNFSLISNQKDNYE